MASRVYWKGLKLGLGQVERYIERNDAGLQSNLTAPQYACVQAVLAAILECINLLPPSTPGA